MSLADRLKESRIRKGFNQLEVSRILSIGNKTISDYERDVSSPDNDSLVRLANLYEVSTDYLLGRTDTPNEVDQSHDFKFACSDYEKLTDSNKEIIDDLAAKLLKGQIK